MNGPAPQVEVNGHLYVIGKMPAMVQFHVVRRLAPVVTAMGLRASELTGAENLNFADLMPSIMNVVATMKDEDVEYVVNSCLDAVRRMEGDKPVPVRAGKLMRYQDIDMGVMMRLTVETIQENLASFFTQPPGAIV